MVLPEPAVVGSCTTLLINDNNWNLTWSLTGNDNEKLGNRLPLTADGSRLAVRRHIPKSIEVYDISATGEATLAGQITQEARGDTVTLSPDGSHLDISKNITIVAVVVLLYPSTTTLWATLRTGRSPFLTRSTV